jgi:hypothetical protein
VPLCRCAAGPLGRFVRMKLDDINFEISYSALEKKFRKKLVVVLLKMSLKA